MSSNRFVSIDLGIIHLNIMEDVFNYVKKHVERDLILQCLDGVTRVHKCILQAASPLFKEVLSAPGNENLNKVYLPYTEQQDLMHVINLIYEGNLQIHENRLENIKKTAQYLNIHLPKITEVGDLEENFLALLLQQSEQELPGTSNQSDYGELEPQLQNEEDNEYEPEETEVETQRNSRGPTSTRKSRSRKRRPLIKKKISTGTRNKKRVKDVEPQQQNGEESQTHNEQDLVNSTQEYEENASQSQNAMDDVECLEQHEPEIEENVDQQDPLSIVEVVAKVEETHENSGRSTSNRRSRKRKSQFQIAAPKPKAYKSMPEMFNKLPVTPKQRLSLKNQPTEPNENQFKCRFCFRIYAKTSKTHVRECVSNPDRITKTCPICEAVVKPSGLSSHLKIHRPRPKADLE